MGAFSEKTKEICDIYIHASESESNGIHVYSTDEKTGIHAREHMNPSISMKEGCPERIDPEYIRHGTSGLIASRNVATGEIVAPLVQPERKEPDFLRHIECVFSISPSDRHVFITDNLNTHVSESLVKFVAEIEGMDETSLGVKGKCGILKSMESRSDFLADKSHQVCFVYTPKHCSWLNQIECWFGIITRRLLNRKASFISVADLEKKIMAFINYYNQFLKKPFQWNYKGKLLKV